ncbi:uncharacterized protein LOC120849165 [Ixodes scapularis]|uniref:uncharacterized protein LOC120849165 n=1 Tax=Ixodes scapularis TaxID=6945 RepID=UPI001A9F4947|nr:uncharacterized protein LOC120849165 [Ixodes scapularis]
MSLEAFRWHELVQVCTELGIDLGQTKRKPHIIELLEAEDVSVEEFTEAPEEVRAREREERRKRADEEARERARGRFEWALKCERWELEKRQYKREMERLDYEFEHLELAKKAREMEALSRTATGVEGVTGKACQGKEKVGAGDTEMTGDQRLSPDTAVTALRKPHLNSERRSGESDVEAATEVVCQEKRKMEAGDTEVTGNQHVSSDATDAVPRKTDAVPYKTDRTPKRREKEERDLRASGGDFPDDEGDAKTETTPGKSIQLTESSA